MESVAKRLCPEIETAEVIALSREQSLFRFDEAERVEELFFGNLLFAAVIDVQAIAFFDPVDREFGRRLVLDSITGFELDSDKRCRRKDVLPHLFGSRKTDLNTVAICGDHKSQAELGLGTTNPSLAG